MLPSSGPTWPVALALALATCADAERPALTCAEAVRREAWTEALTACRSEWNRTHASGSALNLGRARFATGDFNGCREVVGPWLEGDGATAADAHQLYGLALRDGEGEGDKPRAEGHLERARRLHEANGDLFGEARDQHALAGFSRNRGSYREALVRLDRAADLAVRAGNRRVAFYALLGRADLLRTVGDDDEAERVLDASLRVASGPHERSWAQLKLGMLYLQTGSDALARPRLQEAFELARARAEVQVSFAAQLNLIFLTRREGKLDEAEAALDALPPDGDPFFQAFNRALIAVDRGDFGRAAAEYEKAARAGAPDEFAWALASYVGILEERRGNVAAAEAAYRKAIEGVTRLRDEAGASLAAHVLALRRMPYERLVGLLASAGRWREALEVVGSLDLGAVIATAATPTELAADGAPLRPRGTRPTLTPVGWAAEGPGGGAASQPPGVDALLEAWRGRRLVVLMPGGERVWRLEADGGELRGVDVGARAELERLASRLEGHPGDVDAARALGEAMVPRGRGGATVDLLVVGPLGRVPLAALRHGDAPVVASTPLARVLGLRAWRAPSGRGAGRVVVGDPRGDLPAAADEARWVAGRLGATARLGAEAGRDALAAGRDADLLHVAAHAVEGAEGAALRLADRDVAASEIAALGPAARVVVLASCASAASRDGTGWGSLAAAFVVAGAEAVVATQWSVDDGDAAKVVKALYDDPRQALADPARALAAAQARLAADVPPRAWAAFTVVRAPPVVAPRHD